MGEERAETIKELHSVKKNVVVLHFSLKAFILRDFRQSTKP